MIKKNVFVLRNSTISTVRETAITARNKRRSDEPQVESAFRLIPSVNCGPCKSDPDSGDDTRTDDPETGNFAELEMGSMDSKPEKRTNAY